MEEVRQRREGERAQLSCSLGQWAEGGVGVGDWGLGNVTSTEGSACHTIIVKVSQGLWAASAGVQVTSLGVVLEERSSDLLAAPKAG